MEHVIAIILLADQAHAELWEILAHGAFAARVGLEFAAKPAPAGTGMAQILRLGRAEGDPIVQLDFRDEARAVESVRLIGRLARLGNAHAQAIGFQRNHAFTPQRQTVSLGFAHRISPEKICLARSAQADCSARGP